MTRIIFAFDRLRELATQQQHIAQEIRIMEGRLGQALNALDWETRHRMSVEGSWSHVRQQAASLRDQCNQMAIYLFGRAQAFEEIERVNVVELQKTIQVALDLIRGSLPSMLPSILFSRFLWLPIPVILDRISFNVLHLPMSSDLIRPQSMEPETQPKPVETPTSFSTLPYSPNMNHLEFIDFVGNLAKKSQQQTKVPASVTIAQSVLETGWGKSSIGDANNLFGIKGSGTAGSIEVPTKEFLNGQWVTVNASFAKYSSFEDSVTAHANLLATNPVYAEAMKHTDSPDEFARQLQGHYATDPQYANKLISIMKSYDLYRFDK